MKKILNQSEDLLLELINISERLKCNLIEATLEFCNLQEIEVDDFVGFLDEQTIKRLQKNALELYMVRRKDFSPIKELPLV